MGRLSVRGISYILAGAALVPLLVVGAWAVTDVIVHETGDAEFCGGCHAMQPMVTSFREDVHGGAGTQGVEAACTDCHTPHDNPLNYLWSKTRFGVHSVWAQLTYDIDKIDWEAKREERERLVFDSGCLTCHGSLERASDGDAVMYTAHRPYFLGTTTRQCVTCHQNVGHANLSEHLNRVFGT